MTEQDKKGRQEFGRVVELLVEDILATPDAEILAEFQREHGSADIYAADMRSRFETAVIKANKSKMALAKANLAAASRSAPSVGVVDIRQARNRLHRFLSSDAAQKSLTMAARKEGELSDGDVLEMLEDLIEMGFMPSDDQDGSR